MALLLTGSPPVLADHNPDPPKNLRVVSFTTDSITIGWEHPDNRAAAFWYYHEIRTSPDGTWGSVGVDGTTTTDFRRTFQGLSLGTYDIRMRSCQSLQAHCGPYVQITASTLPSPTNVVATATSATEIHLQWDAPTGAVSYQAQIKKTADSDWFTGRQPVTETEITFGSSFTIEGDESYDLRVRACADAQATGCSLWTATLTLRTPLTELTPINFTITNVGVTSVTLRWNSPPTLSTMHPNGYDDDAIALSGYEVQSREYVAGQRVGDGWGAVQTAPEGEEITWEVMGLEPGTAYEFRLRTIAVDIVSLDPNPAELIRYSPYVLLQNQVDYDADDDGLIDIRNLAQLNAIRYDLDGDGVPSSGNETDYAAAFPAPLSGMGCPDTDDPDSDPGPCLGYELLNDLDFDENGDGEITSTDATYWNDGEGWLPFAGAGLSFNATCKATATSSTTWQLPGPSRAFPPTWYPTLSPMGLTNRHLRGRKRAGWWR